MSFANLLSSEGPVLLCILSHLDNLRDVRAALYVCKAWRQMMNNSATWRMVLSRWQVSEDNTGRCSAWKCKLQQTPVYIYCSVSCQNVMWQNDRTAQGLALDLLLLNDIWQDLQAKPSNAVHFLPVLLGKSKGDEASQVAKDTPQGNAAAAWTSCLAEEGAMQGPEQLLSGHSHSMIASMRRISQSLQPAQLDGNGLWKALCRMMNQLNFCMVFDKAYCDSYHALPPLVCGISRHNYCLGVMLHCSEHKSSKGKNWLLQHLQAWAHL